MIKIFSNRKVLTIKFSVQSMWVSFATAEYGLWKKFIMFSGIALNCQKRDKKTCYGSCIYITMALIFYHKRKALFNSHRIS